MESIHPVLTNGISPFDVSGGLEQAKNNFFLDPLSNNPELGAGWRAGAMSSAFEQPLTLSAQEAGNPNSGFDVYNFPESYGSTLDAKASNLTSETGVFTVGGTSDPLLFGGISLATVVPDPGNTLGTAYNVGTLNGTRTSTDSIGSSDTNDYYRFSLGSASNFNLSLTGMSADADVELLDSDGNLITYSNAFGSHDESINRSLTAGNYFVHVYQYSGDTNYTLNLSTTPSSPSTTPSNLLPVETDVGNLSSTQTFWDFVGSTDTSDIYRFSLNAASNFNLSLTGLTSDADVRLIQDINGNGIVDDGDEIVRSQLSGTPDELINRFLSAGNYFVQVYQFSGDTNYRLNLSTTPSFTGSNLLPTETDVGTLVGTRTFSDSVSSTDTSDIYRFTVGQSGIFTANLNGLTGDADVRLIQDSNNNGVIDQGEVIAWQWERGTGSESIRHFLNSGNYFMQVMSYNNQTANYSLSTNFTAAASDDRQFSMQVNFANSANVLTDAMKQAVRNAAQFWENAIPYSSFNGNHTLTVTVGGSNQQWDNNRHVLASASYRNVARDANGHLMPTTGMANVNTNPDAISALTSDINYFTRVMIHEFGHVLGIGTLWQDNGRNFVRSADGTYNSNTYAGWAYGELNHTFRQTAIPLTTGVGAGSDLSHWREQVFNEELMTNSANGTMPLSQMTIASLRDIGWNVNYGAAESYSLGNNVVRVTINRVQAIDNPDGLFAGDADFYAQVNIAGLEQHSSTIADRNDISPNWQFSHGVNSSTVPITIRIFDSDGGPFNSDDHIDINPLRGQRDLQLTYNLSTGRISSSDGSSVSGGRGELITVRGAGDSDRALLQFTVAQFPV